MKRPQVLHHALQALFLEGIGEMPQVTQTQALAQIFRMYHRATTRRTPMT
jgi:hypothetical protein